MALRTLPGTTDRRVDKLLTLLADNAMIVVSGGKIAREIGVARSTRSSPFGSRPAVVPT